MAKIDSSVQYAEWLQYNTESINRMREYTITVGETKTVIRAPGNLPAIVGEFKGFVVSPVNQIDGKIFMSRTIKLKSIGDLYNMDLKDAYLHSIVHTLYITYDVENIMEIMDMAATNPDFDPSLFDLKTEESIQLRFATEQET